MSELGRTQIAVQNHNGPRSLLHRGEAACVQTMITLRTRTELSGITGIQVTDFLVNRTDEEYQRWWPGTHLSFYTIHRVPGEVGNVVVMNEFIGQRSVTVQGIVTEVEPGRRLVWQFRKLVRWPVRLSLQLDENGDVLQADAYGGSRLIVYTRTKYQRQSPRPNAPLRIPHSTFSTPTPNPRP